MTTRPQVGAAATYTPPSPKGHRAAVIASFLGWTLDAFDFFLIVMTVSAIAKDFGKPDKAIALSLTLTLASRPIGAIIFGLMADRYGRKIPLMIDLVCFSIVEVATGFAHSYMTFMVLRVLFGIGMGGEWGVGASLAMEKAPTKQRGFLSGLLQEGYATGYLLAALAYWFIFPRWGWRPLFFLGGIPALLAIYVRSNVEESEVWERTKSQDWGSLLRAVGAQWKLLLYMSLLMGLMGFVSHGTQDMYPTFLKTDWKFTPQRVAALTAFSQVGAILGGLFFGYLSDRIGRRKAIVLALILAALSIPLWVFSPTLVLLALGAFVIQFMVQGAWGVIPVHINELAPNAVRGFMPGFAYQIGMALAASVPYIEAVFAEHMEYKYAMSMVAITVFIGAGIAVWFGGERHRVEFG